MKKLISKLQSVYVALVLLFLYLPIFLLMVYSFNDSRYMGNWSGFTFDWYIKLFSNEAIMEALLVSLSVAFLSATIATIIGTFAALGIHSLKKRTKKLVLSLSYIPIVNPDIVTGISLMLLFVFIGFTRGYTTMLIAHITFNLPFVIFSVLPKLSQMPSNLYEAALDLGATPFKAMRKVVMPFIMPGVITGFLFAFTLSLDDFVITFFTTQGMNNLSTLVYSMAKRGISPEINALSTLMFIVVVLLLVIINIRTRREKDVS